MGSHWPLMFTRGSILYKQGLDHPIMCTNTPLSVLHGTYKASAQVAWTGSRWAGYQWRVWLVFEEDFVWDSSEVCASDPCGYSSLIKRPWLSAPWGPGGPSCRALGEGSDPHWMSPKEFTATALSCPTGSYKARVSVQWHSRQCSSITPPVNTAPHMATFLATSTNHF